MAEADPNTASRLTRMGMPLIKPKQGLAALAGVLSQGTSQAPCPCLAAVPFEWPTFLGRLPSKHKATFAEFDTKYVPQSSGSAAQIRAQPEADTRATAGGSRTAKSPSGINKAAVHKLVQSALKAVIGTELADSEPLMAGGPPSLGFFFIGVAVLACFLAMCRSASPPLCFLPDCHLHFADCLLVA